MIRRRAATLARSYYGTSAQAEIDLVLEGPRRRVFAIEVKRTLSPVLSRGYQLGFDDIGATRGFVVTPEGERFPLAPKVEAVPLRVFVDELPDLVA